MPSSALTSRNASNAKEESVYPDASSNDDNEKEHKIERTQGARFKNLMLAVVMILGVLGLLEVLTEPSPTHNHDSNSNSNPNLNNAMLHAMEPSISELLHHVEELDTKVRNHKNKKGIMMEIDPIGLKLTKELQFATHRLLVKRYGRHAAYRVVVNFTFQKSIPDYKEKGDSGRIVIEMAPIDLLPVSVFNFMEIARTWKNGAVHRNAGHVLQVIAHSDIKKPMPFQEYSPEFPHQKGTTGYAGRPSGPGWYISIQDNSQNHGPGSQQKANPHEADSNFGRVVEGLLDVVPRIHSTPQGSWLDKENQILIPSMEILVSDGGSQGGFVRWESTETANANEEESSSTSNEDP